MIVSLRTAKARLSELLERAAAGEEVVITCNGKPKARLVAIREHRPFRVHKALLERRPLRAGRPAEVLVREDRDSRD